MHIQMEEGVYLIAGDNEIFIFPRYIRSIMLPSYYPLKAIYCDTFVQF